MTLLAPSGEVAQFINLSQFLSGHTEYACGPFAVSHIKYATAPNVANGNAPHDAQKWAFSEYVKHIGPDTPNDVAGSLISTMHLFYQDAGLHWWDMPVAPGSLHNEDVLRIKRALAAGYPVIATIEESSVFDVGLGKNPYLWPPSGTHVVVVSGLSRDGNFLVQDTANITGALQGENWTRPGPRVYDASRLVFSYASIIQTAWLVPIPGGDPLAWSMSFNGQASPTPWEQTAQGKQAADVWEIGKDIISVLFPGHAIDYNSGIAQSWKEEYKRGINHGYPTTPEIGSCNWSGSLIIMQWFSTGDRCEWLDGRPQWYQGSRFLSSK